MLIGRSNRMKPKLSACVRNNAKPKPVTHTQKRDGTGIEVGLGFVPRPGNNVSTLVQECSVTSHPPQKLTNFGHRGRLD